jgi:septal ring factor EnvC (AmiA/AmiB activator)
MAKCKKCSRKGIFLKVSAAGVCMDCERIVKLQLEEVEVRKLVETLNIELSDKNKLYQSISDKAKAEALNSANIEIANKNKEIAECIQLLSSHRQEVGSLATEIEKSQRTLNSNATKLQKMQTQYKSMKYSVDKFLDSDVFDKVIGNSSLDNEVEEVLAATIELKLHCLNVRQLRKLYTQNSKIIQDTLVKYQSRYTTKANAAIYKLMVIALEAELQNVLYNINYGKLDKAIDDIKIITSKYARITTDGNQSISPTIMKFIGEIEFLFVEAIKIEYEYYVQKERIKEEQRAIRDQMKQEAEERKQLDLQRKQVEKEEEKYKNEIKSITDQMLTSTDDKKMQQFQIRINQLQDQLLEVEHKKEEIINRQNGKAGYVYVISNMGSFGDEVFKIGMTRRLEPQDRINELGSASVPFPFDVHSFIFSDDAVSLEQNVHKTLNNSRVNKVNLRKENIINYSSSSSST